MLRYLIFPFLSLLLFSCNQTEPAGFFSMSPDDAAAAGCQRSDLEKMHWLSGDWEGEDGDKKLQYSFRLLVENGFSSMDTAPGSPVFSWHEGRWYYGTNHQWVVSWIGGKDVRFEPNVAGVSPMTWTRLNEVEWHLIRHTPKGDKVVEMKALRPLPS